MQGDEEICRPGELILKGERKGYIQIRMRENGKIGE